MTNKIELLPCPFCGSDDLLGFEPSYEGGWTLVKCRKCGCSGPSKLSQSDLEAAAYWNTRAAPAEDVRAVVDEPSDEQILEAMRKPIYEADGGYVWDTERERVLEAGRAVLALHRPQRPVVMPEKYDDVLLPFLALMRAELHANAHKGDRPGWLSMDRKTAVLEVFYHMGKLHQAVHRNEAAAIQEYAADVANMCMMLTDVCGCLDEFGRLNPEISK